MRRKMPLLRGKEIVDTYGYPVRKLKGRVLIRHPKCTCKIPCQRRYRCEATHHKGLRSTPWCSGAADNEPGWCDDCWAEVYANDDCA